MLKIDDISKTFFPGTVNERKALQDLSLELEESDFVTVIGSNGAGKSTLLNTISGRLPIDSGSIRIDGAEVSRMPEHRRAKYLGRVFQDPMAGTAPDLTIEQNLSLALKRGQSRGLGRGTTSARREHFKDELATLELGLENRLKTKVGLLSGGQRQALSLLMALDPQRAALVTALTKKIVENDGLTTLMVTHNMEQAIALGNRLIMMHEGRIIYQATAEQKKDLTVETLLGEFSKLKGASLGDRALLN